MNLILIQRISCVYIHNTLLLSLSSITVICFIIPVTTVSVVIIARHYYSYKRLVL